MIPYSYRPRKCKQCRESFTPERAGQRAHTGDCEFKLALAVVERRRAKRAKVERAETRVRKVALQKIPELIALAQKEFNAYIRERDKDQPCICCGRSLGEGDLGGAFDCGHYRSRGSAPHLRFDERNAHAQRKHCNRYGAGRAVDYRIGLVARIGRPAVEALESDNTSHKWAREELRAIRATYKAKLKDLKAQRQEQTA